jgi:hypothetical protein
MKKILSNKTDRFSYENKREFIVSCTLLKLVFFLFLFSLEGDLNFLHVTNCGWGNAKSFLLFSQLDSHQLARKFDQREMMNCVRCKKLKLTHQI